MSKTLKIKDGDNRNDIRATYGQYLSILAESNDKIIVLDAETSNSTGADIFKTNFPNKFIECYIAEQNMIGVATGLSINGYIPFISTFGAFLTRGFDQLRMAGYGDVRLNIIGTHVGSSIGQDGVSQMALEDISMFGSILKSQIFYPADIIAYQKILELMVANNNGLNYCRVTRGNVNSIYDKNAKFVIGGSNIVYRNHNSEPNIAIITGGFTLEECIKASKELENIINTNVIDLYCLKPVDKKMLLDNLQGAKKILVVEDHYRHGGITSIVAEVLGDKNLTIRSISVDKIPSSGTKDDLYDYLGLDSKNIKTKLIEMYSITNS